MITKKGWASQCMMSFFTKEATYDAGVTMNNTNACSMRGFDLEIEWPDEVENDGEEITGYEEPTDSEILAQRVEMTYSETRAKPNTLIGLAALHCGSITSTQDAALTAYKHNIVRSAAGVALPSIQAEAKIGGVQYAYKGVKSAQFGMKGDNRRVSVSSKLIGSGTRATSATAFAAAISEGWLKVANCKVWMESGADISISAAPVQGSEDISSATPVDLSVRFKEFEFNLDNAPEGQGEYGGGLVYQDIDVGPRRKQDLKFSLLFNDTTEMDHFTNQDPLAIELDLKGPIVTAGSVYYFGFHLIIPRFKLMKAPVPKGGGNDIITAQYECDIQNDGTNAPFILEGYNAIDAYLA